jgi:lipid II:glycine glycyltransferase (peptidoglycan interpeptide bridge formation enzyme)
MRITLLSKNSTVAGGLLMFTYKPQKTVYFQYLSLNRTLPNTYHPTYYLFWEAINWAWNNNYEKISFGPQHLDENNPRYRIKNEFGGNFEPIYSKMIPLTNLFTLGYKGKQYLNRLHFF